MKLAITNIAWAPELDCEILAFLRQEGIEGLEIAPTRIFPDKPYSHLAEATEWTRTLKDDFDLQVPSMQSIWYGREERMFGSDARPDVLFDYTCRAIDFARTIGCRNLVFGNPRQRDSENPAADMPAFINFMRRLGQYAAECGCIVALEANPAIYNTRMVNTTVEAIEIVREINSHGVGLNLDLGTMIYNGENAELVSQARGLISHVHISEPYLAPIVPREIHSQVVHALAAGGYTGYVSIEMGNRATTEDVKAAVKYLKSLAKA